MTTYKIRGSFSHLGDDAAGYQLGPYANAAGVALGGYGTEAEAEAAARKIEETPDQDGVAPTCWVVAE